VNSPIRLFRAIVLAGLIVGALMAQTPTNVDPDELYRQREDSSSAARAADLWAQRSSIDVEAA
jgi:hypothetical protein